MNWMGPRTIWSGKRRRRRLTSVKNEEIQSAHIDMDVTLVACRLDCSLITRVDYGQTARQTWFIFSQYLPLAIVIVSAFLRRIAVYVQTRAEDVSFLAVVWSWTVSPLAYRWQAPLRLSTAMSAHCINICDYYGMYYLMKLKYPVAYHSWNLN